MKRQTRNKSKVRAERYHFRTRCIERLGLTLDQDELVKLIQAGKLPKYDRMTNRITRWLYTHEGREYVLVYDNHRHQLVTILYKDWIGESIEGEESENSHIKTPKDLAFEPLEKASGPDKTAIRIVVSDAPRGAADADAPDGAVPATD